MLLDINAYRMVVVKGAALHWYGIPLLCLYVEVG